jgi:phospholipase/lecithinase/hemolysin
MKRGFAFTLAFGALLAMPVSLFAGTLSQFVVFGDSLSDTGNLYIATGGLPPAPAPPLYAKGLFTDGPDSTPSTSGPLGIWIQQLAGMMGVASPAPFLAGTGGTDYAFGGALTGHDPNPAGVPYVTDQLDAYLAGHPSGVPSTALYTFWAGANDIFQGMSPATAVANLTGNINTLFADGGRDFLWLDMPPLGDTPDGLALGAAGSAALNLLSQEYNTAWLSAIGLLNAEDPGIDIVGADVFGLVEAMLADPSKYGFVNINTPAQGLSVDPNTYLFWDGVHPTTEGDFQVASLADHDLATPEPSTALLLGTAFLAGVLVFKGRHRASA